MDTQENRLSIEMARRRFSHLVSQAAYAGRRTIIFRYSRPAAAIVS